MVYLLMAEKNSSWFRLIDGVAVGSRYCAKASGNAR
jgi:hypothetical protein